MSIPPSVDISKPVAELVELLTQFGERLRQLDDHGDAQLAVAQLAVQVLVPAQEAGITEARNAHFSTAAATGELALAVDSIQYELRDGPCVDAVQYDPIYRTDDLRTDERWPRFGALAYERTGVLSMLAVRIFLENDLEAGLALNMYSTEPGAFTAQDMVLAQLLATHAALALTNAALRQKTDHLQIALETNREIGIAIGVLMSRHKVTRDDAFQLLRLASQHAHRKLSEIARDVVETGDLPLPR